MTAIAEQQEHSTGKGRRGRLPVLAHRLPFTTGAVLVLVVIGVATGTLWSAAMDRSWFPDVAYGLPSLDGGRWWTVATGAVFTLSPIFYPPILLSFAVLVGLAEWRLGTLRTAVICLAGHLVGVLGAASTLLVLRHSGWDWAENLSTIIDVGISAGALACGAAVSAVVRAPWRLRLRAALLVYVGVSILFIGTLADLEHLWAVAFAMPLGRRLAGVEKVPGRKTVETTGRREWRLLAATGMLVIALAEVVLWLFPAEGPLGSTDRTDSSAFGVLLDVVVVGLIVNGLRLGRTWAWWGAVALAVLNVAAGAVVAIAAGFSQAVVGEPDAATRGMALSVAAGVLWAAELTLLLLRRRAFLAPSPRRLRRRGTPAETDPATARALLEQTGGGTLSFMTTWPDNSYFLSPDGRSFLAYQRHAGVAIALGDPVARPGQGPATVSTFVAMCERTGLVPALFSVSGSIADVAVSEWDWHRVQIAEDNLIDLADLEFRGRKWQDARSALNRAVKENISYREVVLADESWAIRTQVRAISQGWVDDKGLPEMGFTLGGIDQAMDPDVRVGLAIAADGSVHGVTSWLPVWGPEGAVRGWTLDIMRRRTDGFRPVIEFLIASAALSFQAQGAEFISLSGAPLARTSTDGTQSTVEKLLDTLGATMEPYYGFRSLHAFKTKFNPRYEAMYLAYRDEGDLPRIAIALARAYLPGADVRDLVKLATSRPS